MGIQSVICDVAMASGKVYKIRSFVKNAKLIEQNTRLQTNIDLLVNKPEEEGYLGILMLPNNAGQSPENGSLMR